MPQGIPTAEPCDSSACIEVTLVTLPDHSVAVAILATAIPDQEPVLATHEEFAAFIARVKAGDLDALAS